MKWYQMYKNKAILKKIESEFNQWKESTDLDTMLKLFEDKQESIAEKYGFSKILKTSYLLIFENKDNQILIAWHDDHKAHWDYNDEGFDGNQMDLIDYYYKENIISKKEIIELFEELHDFSSITEKQQSALENILEYCSMQKKEQEIFYNDKPYSPKDYQNIYHNIWNNQKLKEKIVIRDFLEFLEFF